jgi:hypothetical protein
MGHRLHVMLWTMLRPDHVRSLFVNACWNCSVFLSHRAFAVRLLKILSAYFGQRQIWLKISEYNNENYSRNAIILFTVRLQADIFFLLSI